MPAGFCRLSARKGGKSCTHANDAQRRRRRLFSSVPLLLLFSTSAAAATATITSCLHMSAVPLDCTALAPKFVPIGLCSLFSASPVLLRLFHLSTCSEQAKILLYVMHLMHRPLLPSGRYCLCAFLLHSRHPSCSSSISRRRHSFGQAMSMLSLLLLRWIGSLSVCLPAGCVFVSLRPTFFFSIQLSTLLSSVIFFFCRQWPPPSPPP